MTPILNGRARHVRLTSLLILATLAAAAPALPAGKTAPPALAPAPYHVTVTPLLRRVEAGQEFPVILRVTNSSPVPQSFAAMGCSWIQNWQARPAARLKGEHVDLGEPTPCYWNPCETIRLKPGESYQKQTVMCVWSEGKPHNVSFQVGFTTSPEGKPPIYWSDEAAVDVVK